MSVVQLLVLLYIFKPQVAVCPNVTGSVHTRQGFNDLIQLSPTPMSGITLKYTITFPSNTTGRPLMYIQGTEAKDPWPNYRRCFVPKIQLIANKHYIPLSGNYAIDHCSHITNDTILCIGTVTFGYLKPRYWFAQFGYVCGERDHLLSLTYNLYINNNTADECNPLVMDNACMQHVNNTGSVYFPNRFGHNEQSEALLYRRQLDMFLALSSHNGKKHCYMFIITFLCISLYPACSKDRANGSNNTLISEPTNDTSAALVVARTTTFIVPCRRMCEELFQGCQSEFTMDGTIECEKYPSGLTDCLYLEVKCPQLDQSVLNGYVVISSSEASHTATHRLNDTVEYACNEGFIMHGPSKITCLPSGQWSAPVPKCKANWINLQPAMIISFTVVFTIMLLSMVILVCYKNHLLCSKKLDPGLHAIQNRTRKVFVSFSSQNEPDVELFILDLRRRNPLWAFITYHDDFILGNHIITAIHQAVWEDSDAFVSYVTQDFIDSNWCLHEFREARRREQLEDGFQVVVVMDAKMMSQLVRIPKDIKTYLTTQTYLYFNDTCFWDKLKNALSDK